MDGLPRLRLAALRPPSIYPSVCTPRFRQRARLHIRNPCPKEERQMNEQKEIKNTYSVGHSRYYRLGGTVLRPKQIRESVRASGYRGYRAEYIEAADMKAEPHRSSALRRMREKAKADLADDLSRYRICALELHRIRIGQKCDFESICDNVSLGPQVRLGSMCLANSLGGTLRIHGELLNLREPTQSSSRASRQGRGCVGQESNRFGTRRVW